MAMEGLLALVCAGAVLTGDPTGQVPQASPDDANKFVEAKLAVQAALQKGNELLLRGEYAAAVDVLESQLAQIDGNRVYLNLLRDAYRGYIKELRLARRDGDAKRYLDRLQLLDRGAILDSALAGPAVQKSGPAAEPPRRPLLSSLLPSLLPGKAAATPPSKTTPVVRLKSEEEAGQAARLPEPSVSDAKAVLAKANQEFENRHYKEARLLFEQAYQADQKSVQSCRERWAYCKLFYVVDQLNQPANGTPPGPDLEQEVRLALSLAPNLEYGKQLLGEVQKRRGGGATAAAGQPRDAQARNLGRNAEGWNVSETANFRIFHQSQEFSEQVAQIAERTRASMQQKWFGGGTDAWNPKCDIYLHPTADAYGRATGQYNSPGHSTMRLESGRMVIRRIDLHCDDQNMLSAVLPHETTHVVLAGQFGEQLLPRWADEGMAVLTEPSDKIDRHRANLNKCRQEGQTFRVQDLMQLEDYPQNPRYIGAFFAQSVSLVDYLANLRGPQTFVLFMHEGLRYGYEKALLRQYNIQSFTDLEQKWGTWASRERAGANGVAAR